MRAFQRDDVPVPPPPRPIEHSDLDDSGWWLSLLIGVPLVVLGLWMLANPFESVAVLAWLVGVSLMIGGLLEIAGLRGAGRPAWLAGGLLVLAGLVVLAWPDITLGVLAFLAGVSLLLWGGLRLFFAVANHGRAGWIGELVLAALSLVLGVLILVWPEATVVVIAVFFGVRAILTGLLAIGVGWQLHRLAT